MKKITFFDTQFWKSALFKKIKSHGEMRVLVYMYLRTNGLHHPLGIYRISYGEIATDLEISTGLVKNHIELLEKLDVCRYDELTQTLWLCDSAGIYLEGLKAQDKRIIGAINTLKRFETLSFMPEFYERYKPLLHLNAPVPEKQKKTPNIKSTVMLIFKTWQDIMGHPRAKLDTKRYRCIEKALQLYSLDELNDAIRGCKLTPYNMGDNTSGQRYDDITLILRDATHIERFIRHAACPPQARTQKTYYPRSSQNDPSFGAF